MMLFLFAAVAIVDLCCVLCIVVGCRCGCVLVVDVAVVGVVVVNCCKRCGCCRMFVGCCVLCVVCCVLVEFVCCCR